jgi:predicted metal-binding membrane protein
MQKAMMSETTDYDSGRLPPAVAGLGYAFARPKVLAALCVIVLTGLGWLYLALLLVRTGGSFSEFSAGAVQALCQPLTKGTWSGANIAIVGSMWAAMTLMMMLPSASPMILTYADIAETAARKGEKIVSPFALAIGYTVIWFGFSAVAALVQIASIQAALLDANMAVTGALFSGAIFIGAGVYQFSALKHACLTRCQHPFPFFFANWTTTWAGVFRLGLKQGLYCLGCCWAMMSVMFAVGVMNVIWMAGLGIIMTIEKMLVGRRFTHAVGVVLITVGVGIVLMTFASHWPAQAS